LPRRNRGHDVIWWLETMRLDQMTIEQRGSDPTLALIPGAYGGHTIDFREFAAQGITLLGRLQALGDGVLHFADDLGRSLDYGDAAYSDFLERVDRFVARRGMNVSADPEARARREDPPEVGEPLRQIDMRRSGLSSIVWATG